MEHSCFGDGRQTAAVLLEIIPDLARVAVPWTNRADAAEQLREIDRVAHALARP